MPHGFEVSPSRVASARARPLRKVAAAAAAKATELNLNMVFAVVDTGGQLVYFERADVVQWGSNDVAIHKAKASVQYKRPTLALKIRT